MFDTVFLCLITWTWLKSSVLNNLADLIVEVIIVIAKKLIEGLRKYAVNVFNITQFSIIDPKTKLYSCDR